MHYYEVWVRSQRYRGKSALTYSHPDMLQRGTIVTVPLQKETVFGVVISETKTRPRVPIKPIEGVSDVPPLPPQLLDLGGWLQGYYRSSIGAIAQTLTPAAITKVIRTNPPVLVKHTESKIPELSQDQKKALLQINGPGSYLLHGRTGSGKTRIYQDLATQQIGVGRSVLILSPEIGLTSQLVSSFEELGLAPVINLHSKMTNAQRFQAWLQIANSTTPLIIVGARSALFSPIKNLGLVVVDEFHETSYKQDQEPRYHAPRVAAVLARLHQAVLVYGSATPAVVDYFIARDSKTPVLSLEKLAVQNNVVANTKVVDLRDRQQFTKSSILSDLLIDSVHRSLEKSEQSMLYLNRRGTARVSLCQNCGWQAICPRCDLPLTYHGDSHTLRCHTCDTSMSTPSSCPECGNAEIIFRGVGTKALVEEARRLFPRARLIRFDSDNKAVDSLESQYEHIKQGGVDIIIGTQTLAKGLDLPMLSTLGVVIADSSLQIPDYTASERTFQLISQVLGRVQRGHRASTAVVQTYNPTSPVIQAAITGDFDNFYQTELEERRLFNFPPYRQLLIIRCRRKTAASAERSCKAIIDNISVHNLPIDIEGPAPALHERSSAGYTWQVIIKATSRATLLRVVDNLPSTVTSYDLDPINLL